MSKSFLSGCCGDVRGAHFKEFVQRCNKEAAALSLTIPEGVLGFVCGLEPNAGNLSQVMVRFITSAQHVQAEFTGFSNLDLAKMFFDEIVAALNVPGTTWEIYYVEKPPRALAKWPIAAALPPFLSGSRPTASTPLQTDKWVPHPTHTEAVPPQANKDEGPPELVSFEPVVKTTAQSEEALIQDTLNRFYKADPNMSRCIMLGMILKCNTEEIAPLLARCITDPKERAVHYANIQVVASMLKSME